MRTVFLRKGKGMSGLRNRYWWNSKTGNCGRRLEKRKINLGDYACIIGAIYNSHT